MTISQIKDAHATATSDTTPERVIADIAHGKYRRQVEHLRPLPKAQAAELKKKLPGIMWSGTFSQRKKPCADYLVAHSGLLCADVDGIGGEAALNLRKAVQHDPHVLAAFISPSGTGTKIVFKVSPNPERHLASFNLIRSRMATAYNMAVDEACKDVGRLCFASYDPGAWIKEAQELTGTHSNGKGIAQSSQSSSESSEVIPALPCSGLLCPTQPALSYSVQSVEQAVEICLPTAPRKNNVSLFKLARALLVLNAQHPLSPSDRMAAFSRWHDQTKGKGFLRHDRAHYLTEFMNALKTAIHPLGESPVDAAWREAQAEPMPAEAALFDDEPSKKLVSLCYQLEQGSNGQPWYLSCRDAGRLTGMAHRTCSQWLAGFVALGILSIAEPGTKQHATRYRWKGNKQ